VALLLKSRKMKTIIQLLICLLIFSSCKKEEPETTISGIVVNYGTLKPIDSVMVTVVMELEMVHLVQLKVAALRFRLILII